MPKVIDDTAVFQATMELFVTHGYEEATMQRIAAAAGVHEATLYRKYGDKASLIVRAADHELADTPMNHLAYSGDLKADLTAAAEAYLAANEGHGVVMPTVLAEVQRHPKLRPLMARLIANLSGIVAIMRRYQENGELKPGDPLYVAGIFVGPMLLLQFTLLGLGELPVPPFDTAAYVDQFLWGHGVASLSERDTGEIPGNWTASR